MSENQPLSDHAGPSVQPDPGTALPEPKNPDVSHEHSDVNVRGLLGVAGVMIAVGILLCVLVGGVFHLFQAREAKQDETVPDLVKEDAERPLPERQRSIQKENPPLLEAMEKTLPEENNTPPAYQWIDRKQGIARIPVAAAMRTVLEKNLLPAKEKEEGKEGGERPSSSNSGRGSGEKQP